MQCERCGLILKEGETYNLRGKVLSEDCYFYETNPHKACDPMAVATALSLRKQLGQSGTDGLTALQQQIYNLIEQKGKSSFTNLLQYIIWVQSGALTLFILSFSLSWIPIATFSRLPYTFSRAIFLRNIFTHSIIS